MKLASLAATVAALLQQVAEAHRLARGVERAAAPVGGSPDDPVREVADVDELDEFVRRARREHDRRLAQPGAAST